jgi:hypothetical protein
VTPGTDHPYVYSAEGWDGAFLKGPSTGTFRLRSIGVKYTSRFVGQTANFDEFTFINHTFPGTLGKTFSSTDTHFSFADHIAARRRAAAATTISGFLGGAPVDASQLPLAVRAGDRQHRAERRGPVQRLRRPLAWRQLHRDVRRHRRLALLNFSRDFVQDFAPNVSPSGTDNSIYRCDAGTQRCYDYYGGNLVPYYPGNPYPLRRVARAVFDGPIGGRTDLRGFYLVNDTSQLGRRRRHDRPDRVHAETGRHPPPHRSLRRPGQQPALDGAGDVPAPGREQSRLGSVSTPGPWGSFAKKLRGSP